MTQNYSLPFFSLFQLSPLIFDPPRPPTLTHTRRSVPRQNVLCCVPITHQCSDLIFYFGGHCSTSLSEHLIFLRLTANIVANQPNPLPLLHHFKLGPDRVPLWALAYPTLSHSVHISTHNICNFTQSTFTMVLISNFNVVYWIPSYIKNLSSICFYPYNVFPLLVQNIIVLIFTCPFQVL